MMPAPFRLLAVIALTVTSAAYAAEPLLLDGKPAPAATERGEHEYFSDIFGTEVVTNVTVPTLTPYLPASGQANGIGVVVAPGGGYHALSINSEGNDVAKWLNARGIAAFVLRYRLVQGGDDVVAELVAKPQEQAGRDMAAVAPLAGSDGLAAIKLVRERAASFGVRADRIGIIGFSAGGGVALHVAHHYDGDSRPDFVAPIYAAARWLGDTALPEDAPPAFLLAATDDQLGLAADSVALYERWHTAGKPVELHMYARGGHGFGMRTQDAPSDRWIERFSEWLVDWHNTQAAR